MSKYVFGKIVGLGFDQAVEAATRELAKEGADIQLLDIDAENLEIVAREARSHGVEAVMLVCDLTEPAQITTAVNALIARWGRLNILVNNAGLTYYGSTHDMTAEQWRRIMAVNLLAPIQLCHELLPILFAAEDAHIVNVCSMFGLVSWRKVTAYQTSKFGLVGFSAALRAEYDRANFGVTALCPGFVDTALIEGHKAGDQKTQRTAPSWICTTPETVAAKAIHAIRKNRGMVLITPAAHLYWRMMRISPSLVDWLIREGWRRRGRI